MDALAGLTKERAISIVNDNADIESTNYFDLSHAEQGGLFFSVNGGAIRMLIPDNQKNIIPKIKTGVEVIISRGKFSVRGEDKTCVAIMFDDSSDTPLVITLSFEQFDTIPKTDDRWLFTAWTRDGKVYQSKRCLVLKSEGFFS